jgi:hypothetical protein
MPSIKQNRSLKDAGSHFQEKPRLFFKGTKDRVHERTSELVVNLKPLNISIHIKNERSVERSKDLISFVNSIKGARNRLKFETKAKKDLRDDSVCSVDSGNIINSSNRSNSCERES